MSDNPAEAALNELKKWLELIKKIMAEMEAQKKALAAEQKAIGEKALAAHEKMVAKTKHDELMNQLKEVKEGLKKLPQDTPGLKEAQDQTESIGQDLEGEGQQQEHSLDPDENDLGESNDLDTQNELDADTDNDLADDLQENLENEVSEELGQGGPENALSQGMPQGGNGLAAAGPGGALEAAADFGTKLATRPKRAGSVGAAVTNDLQVVKDSKMGIKFGQGLGKGLG